MQLSVVVPTLNGREELHASLDALGEHVPDAEVVVVNGPSADGTTGMVRERDDVDVLVEISERNINVARNAGIEVATGDVVALVSYDLAVEPSWYEGLVSALDDGAAVVTGPTHRTVKAGMTTEEKESVSLAGREVTYFNGDNVAFERQVLEDMDGFDEYLQTGGARDGAHRLAHLRHDVTWESSMSVRGEFETDGGHTVHDWEWKYRALSYRLVKNYGVRPTVAARAVKHALLDGARSLKGVVTGHERPSSWLGGGRSVVKGMLLGWKDGLAARKNDRTLRRNPNGISTRQDRAVCRYQVAGE
ncbi:glycosyltransferase family 2 protein [Haloarchaeobius amylolyticus]|uniref:glycosyltransferase family 2 protein n=1 Tax=Haloarchaeobius amylolyticus TaxID=1198296 RepID=UPI0022704264|nr:glycosyltransferase [Haloarchaeobius amylolyticus]